MHPPNSDPPSRANTYYAWGVCGLLLLAVGLIFGQTLGHIMLICDDRVFVYENPHVTGGLTSDGIHWAFTDGPYGEWYPLAPLSHMLDVELYGLNSWGHHLTNVLIHAATSIALFLVWWRITGELWPSAFVAAIFAVHPQHVESVAWIAERKDLLCGFFFVLTLGAYLGYSRHGRTLSRYLLVVAMFACGLMSKPMLVTLPPLLLLLDFWPMARIGAASDVPAWTGSVVRPSVLRLVLEKFPLLALSAVDSLMTLSTHPSGGVTLSWGARAGNAAVSCVTYIEQFFYPVSLSAFYPIPLGGHPIWKVAGATTILVAITLGAVIWRRKAPYLFVGWFWYLGMLSPVMGLVKFYWAAMADRYTYLPGIGLYIALAWGATRLIGRSLAGRWVLGACAGLAIVVLTICSVRQASFWRDDETLWTHALTCTADNGEAEVELARAFVKQGRIDEGIARYRQTLDLAYDYRPFNELGLLLARQGKIDEATSLFRRSLEIEPDAFDAHANLGLALAVQNQLDEAGEHLRRAVEIEPLDVKSRCGLAFLLRRQGRVDEARAELERAVQIEPHNTMARTDLGDMLMQQGNIEQAIPQFEAALAADPRFLPAHLNLARANEVLGRTGDAAAHYRQALEIDPNNPQARQGLDKLGGGARQPTP